MVAQIEGTDRDAVERQVLAALWGEKPTRLTARVVNGQYSVSMYTADDEPDGQAGGAGTT